MRRPKKTLLIFFSLILLSLQGCDPIGGFLDFFTETFNPNLEIIRGKKIISDGEEYTIPKGTTVQFKDTVFGNADMWIVIKDSASLIARGTADEPITFKGYGTIVFLESSDDENSIIEYCKFNDVSIKIHSSVNIQYSKFTNSYYCIRLFDDSESVIQYNNFIGLESNFFGSSAINGEDSISPVIQYNNIDSFEGPIRFDINNSSVTIRNNNITFIKEYAIYANIGVIVDNNYIYGCNGISGADTDGQQINIGDSCSYTNPRSSIILDAGCGW